MESEPKFVSTVTWRIENLPSIFPEPYDDLDVGSAAFYLSNLGENQWTLRLQRYDLTSLYNIDLYPCHFVRCVYVVCEWTLLNPDGSQIYQTILHEDIERERSCYMLPFHRDDVPSEKDLFMRNESVNLRLRIWKRTAEFNQSEHVKLITRVLIESVEERFVWRIEGFNRLKLNAKAAATVRLRGHDFTLCFFLTGEDLDGSQLNFSVRAQHAPDMAVKLNISVFGKGTKCAKESHKFRSSEMGQTWMLASLVPRRRILERSSDWLVGGDVLAFLCLFECDLEKPYLRSIESCEMGPGCLESEAPTRDETDQYREITTIVDESCVARTTLLHSKRDVMSQQRKASKSDLQDDLKQLFQEGFLSDFGLRSVDGDAIPVHKSVLCARSSFFRDIFCGGVEPENPMDLQDLDSGTLREFLTFLYVGRVPDLNWESALKLYYASGKYGVDSLRRCCESVLRDGVTPWNVSEVLELADGLQDGELASWVFEFVDDNFDAVVGSEEWDAFLERSYVAGKTMKEIYEKRKHLETW